MGFPIREIILLIKSPEPFRTYSDVELGPNNISSLFQSHGGPRTLGIVTKEKLLHNQRYVHSFVVNSAHVHVHPILDVACDDALYSRLTGAMFMSNLTVWHMHTVVALKAAKSIDDHLIPCLDRIPA